jgi:hypothetical protein
MMNSMMNAMIRGMTKEEREKMMLQMMPEMMKKADINVLITNMMEEMGKMITLYSVYSLITKIVTDPSLKEKFGDMLKSMKEKMPEMMPVMMPIMDELMPKIMSGMMPMMSGMVKEMTEKIECMMIDMVDDDSEMKKMMGEMMFAMCPIMAGKVIPEEKGTEFVKQMEKSVLTDRGIVLNNDNVTEINN